MFSFLARVRQARERERQSMRAIERAAEAGTLSMGNQSQSDHQIIRRPTSLSEFAIVIYRTLSTRHLPLIFVFLLPLLLPLLFLRFVVDIIGRAGRVEWSVYITYVYVNTSFVALSVGKCYALLFGLLFFFSFLSFFLLSFSCTSSLSCFLAPSNWRVDWVRWQLICWRA